MKNIDSHVKAEANIYYAKKHDKWKYTSRAFSADNTIQYSFIIKLTNCNLKS